MEPPNKQQKNVSTENKKVAPFTQLSGNVACCIFNFFGPRQLGRLSMISQTFKTLCSTNQVWRKFLDAREVGTLVLEEFGYKKMFFSEPLW